MKLEEQIRKEWDDYVRKQHMYGETDSKIPDWWLSKLQTILQEHALKLSDAIRGKKIDETELQISVRNWSELEAINDTLCI